MNLVWDLEEVSVAEIWKLLEARRPVARMGGIAYLSKHVDLALREPGRIHGPYSQDAGALLGG